MSYSYYILFGFSMGSVRLAELAIFPQFQFFRVFFLVFRRRVISLLAFAAGKRDYFSHSSSSTAEPL
jgi:hypothetical protein